uniref:Uncharacterized protein n=1 Tax=Anguilla anguilla TaxID=7936 RepID=A0A0E9W1U0_ANGAN
MAVVSYRMTMPPSTGQKGLDEYENYMNHMLWPLQSPDLDPIEHQHHQNTK